jgi:4-hydroxy-tetrahydrodipicolinate synthase
MFNRDKFKTVISALITPFKNGEVDFESLDRLIKNQVENGVAGFVINGTTAESPNLKSKEISDIFKFVRKQVGSEFPLIIGTGSNSTEKTIADSIEAEKWGADAVLVVVPYYNKPPQRGLVQHFTAVAKSISIPVILYNVPGRTITSLSLDSIVELSKVKNIIGIKEASGNIELAIQIIKNCGRNFIMLSGDDGTYIDFLKAGGQGVISVASQILPAVFVEWTKNPLSTSTQISFEKYKKVIELLFIEANPIPLKKALQLMGLISSAELRLPLSELQENETNILQTEMRKVELLTGGFK